MASREYRSSWNVSLPFPFHADDSGQLLRQLAPGTRLRVHLTVEHADSDAPDAKLLVGTLRACDESGVTLGYRFEAEDVEEPIPWDVIRLVEARFRAFFRGVATAIFASLALGWCGHGLDQLTDGFPDNDAQIAGVVIGLVIGLLLWLLTFEWTSVYESDDNSGGRGDVA